MTTESSHAAGFREGLETAISALAGFRDRSAYEDACVLERGIDAIRAIRPPAQDLPRPTQEERKP